jgi:hypothetical protein
VCYLEIAKEKLEQLSMILEASELLNFNATNIY